MIKGTIKSDKGFYVGDICYALAEDVYHGVWGGAGYKADTFRSRNTKARAMV